MSKKGYPCSPRDAQSLTHWPDLAHWAPQGCGNLAAGERWQLTLPPPPTTKFPWARWQKPMCQIWLVNMGLRLGWWTQSGTCKAGAWAGAVIPIQSMQIQSQCHGWGQGTARVWAVTVDPIPHGQACRTWAWPCTWGWDHKCDPDPAYRLTLHYSFSLRSQQFVCYWVRQIPSPKIISLSGIPFSWIALYDLAC